LKLKKKEIQDFRERSRATRRKGFQRQTHTISRRAKENRWILSRHSNGRLKEDSRGEMQRMRNMRSLTKIWKRSLSVPTNESLKPFYALGLNIGSQVSPRREGGGKEKMKFT
jgi:hypothetical protein